ncbi:integrase core domain protein [Edwardsiella piscicida]|nr:integrase core domain protein [Edwardsiella piscicida]
MLIAPSFVFMPRHLTTGDTQFLHHPPGQPSAEFYGLHSDHRGDASDTGGTPTGDPGFTDQETAFVLDALELALWARRPSAPLHHSDKGS